MDPFRGSRSPNSQKSSVEVPKGSASVIMDWVGNDSTRAVLALDVELAKGDNARVSLVKRLKEIVDG